MRDPQAGRRSRDDAECRREDVARRLVAHPPADALYPTSYRTKGRAALQRGGDHELGASHTKNFGLVRHGCTRIKQSRFESFISEVVSLAASRHSIGARLSARKALCAPTPKATRR